MRRWIACTAALGLFGAGGGPLAQTARAQQPTAGAPAPAAYEDRVLDSGPQPDPAPQDGERSSGWPRGWSAELQSTRQDGTVKSRNETLLFSGYLDTPDYGSFSANLNLNRYRNPVSGVALFGSLGTPYTAVPFTTLTGNSWRIDQRGMPFDGGWFGNNSIGNINMAATPLARGVGHIYLPALPIEGASATLERPGRTSINASAGRLGYFDGLDFQGFSLGRGTAVSVGGQTQLAGPDGAQSLGRVDVAAQYVETRDFNANGVSGFAQNTRSIWTAASWQGVAPWADSVVAGYGGVGERIGGLRVQANVAHSVGRPSDPLSLAPRDSGSGAWLDASWRTPLMQQAASVFHFQPSLRWGADGLPSDLRGVSWRGDINTRQWQLSFNTELSDSVSRVQRAPLYASVFGRYRFDSRDAISGNLAARTGDFAAQSAQVTWEHKSDWGYTQLRTDVAHGQDLRVVRSGVDHAWQVGETQTLSTSLAFEQSSQGGVRARSVLWGVLGTTPLPGGVRLDLALRGGNGIGDSDQRFLNANARLSWPLGSAWSLIAQYSASRGQESLNPAVVSALTAATQAATRLLPSTRTVLIALRYENRAGIYSAPIGGAPGSGAGRLEGHVFFDQDRNGRREASEGGVGGVTVVLDRRYVARTDAQGYYSFGSVAAGEHQIELVQDNLPLPWSSAPETGSRRVDISVRDTAVADFPVQRER